MQYLSPEWGRMAVQALRNDPRVAEALQGVKVTLLLRIRDAPKGRHDWLYAAFDGGLAEAKLGQDGDAASAKLGAADFTIEGTYDAFAAIQRGETTEKRALVSGALQVKGNKLTALRYLRPLQTVTKVLAEIPCEA